MNLSVGTAVVYAGHGVGRIRERSKRVIAGAEQEVVLIDLSNGLSVSLPLERAQMLLRAPATESDLDKVGKTLRQDPSEPDKRWLARKQDAEAKLSAGTPLDLAEVIRDSGARSSPSSNERTLYLRARELLAEEIAQVRGLDVENAKTWIDDEVARV